MKRLLSLFPTLAATGLVLGQSGIQDLELADLVQDPNWRNLDIEQAAMLKLEPVSPQDPSILDQFVFAWGAEPGRSYFLVGGYDLTDLEFFPLVEGVEAGDPLQPNGAYLIGYGLELDTDATTDGQWVQLPPPHDNDWVFVSDIGEEIFFMRLAYNPFCGNCCRFLRSFRLRWNGSWYPSG